MPLIINLLRLNTKVNKKDKGEAKNKKQIAKAKGPTADDVEDREIIINEAMERMKEYMEEKLGF
ncbi:MAG: hypothetical protein MK212_01920 [Saprospiraceae bacterium]|nr:hypothetical protein [Saprospiraceae bacterium]